MKVGVVSFPGSNCDLDAYHLVKDVLELPVRYLWHQESSLGGVDLVILPGGFTYGDYLRPGAIARYSPVMKAVEGHARSGGLVLGICNGFQVLTEAGILPGALYRNIHLQFRCVYTCVRIENNSIPYTFTEKRGRVLRLPVAHGDGNYYVDSRTLAEMESRGQVVFRYSDEKGVLTHEANPSGSVDNIAGVCSREGNVLGIMPHPERAGEKLLGSRDGLAIFRSLARYFKQGGFRRG